MPTYKYNTTTSKYQVFASAGNYIIGRNDDGSTSSQIFSPISLSGTLGNPYASPDDTYLYATHTNRLVKYNSSTGASAGGNYPVTLTGVATSVDPVVMNDNIYVATSAGVIHKYDDDGTPLSTYTTNSGTLSHPLHLSNNVLLVAPDNQDSLIAVEVSGLNKIWSVKLGGNNTGGPFSVFGSSDFYTVSGLRIEKVVHGGSSGSIGWTYTVSDSIKSSPIIYSGHVYAGGKSGKLYAIVDATGNAASGWPKTVGSANYKHGPWIDITNNRVVFGAEDGAIVSYELE